MLAPLLPPFPGAKIKFFLGKIGVEKREGVNKEVTKKT